MLLRVSLYVYIYMFCLLLCCFQKGQNIEEKGVEDKFTIKFVIFFGFFPSKFGSF